MKVNWKKVLNWTWKIIFVCFLVYNLLFYKTNLITGNDALTDLELEEITEGIDSINVEEFKVLDLETRDDRYTFSKTHYYLDIDIECLDEEIKPENIDENIRDIVDLFKERNFKIDRVDINYFDSKDLDRNILSVDFRYAEDKDLLTRENLDFKNYKTDYYYYIPSTEFMIENKEYYDWMSLSSHDYLNELLAVEYFSYDDEDKSEIAHLFVESEEDLYLKLKEAFKELVNYDIINQKPLISEFTIDAQIFEDMSKAPKFDPLDTARSGSNPFEKARAARVEEDIRTLHIVTEELYNIDWNEVINYEELKALVDSWNV